MISVNRNITGIEFFLQLTWLKKIKQIHEEFTIIVMIIDTRQFGQKAIYAHNIPGMPKLFCGTAENCGVALWAMFSVNTCANIELPVLQSILDYKE